MSVKQSKKTSRIRRATKTTERIRLGDKPRLLVHRSNNHIEAVITDANGAKVICAYSSKCADLREKKATRQELAAEVGKVIANKAKDAGITTVAFDRRGYKYHGRVKALADGARAAGIEF